MDKSISDLIEEAREFINPEVGYVFQSWHDRAQAVDLIERLLAALGGGDHAE